MNFRTEACVRIFRLDRTSRWAVAPVFARGDRACLPPVDGGVPVKSRGAGDPHVPGAGHRRPPMSYASSVPGVAPTGWTLTVCVLIAPRISTRYSAAATTQPTIHEMSAPPSLATSGPV